MPTPQRILFTPFLERDGFIWLLFSLFGAGGYLCVYERFTTHSGRGEFMRQIEILAEEAFSHQFGTMLVKNTHA